MKTSIATVLAWRLVNYVVEGTLKCPQTKEIYDEGDKDLADEYQPMKIFNALFFNEYVRINYSLTSTHNVLYEFLRPEIITQVPKILRHLRPEDAIAEMGEFLELSHELQYKYHILS